MDHSHVKRLPVVGETGRLVGIVSRADLLRVFLRRDHVIREEISGDTLDRILGVRQDEVVVAVTDGRVSLRGTVERRDLVPVVRRLCEQVDGVVEVTDALEYRTDEAVEVAPPAQRPGVLLWAAPLERTVRTVGSMVSVHDGTRCGGRLWIKKWRHRRDRRVDR